MFRRASSFVPGLVLLIALAGRALDASTRNDRAAREVAAVARSISAAETKGGDLRILERVWADDFVQVSSLGHLDRKKHELEKLRSGTVSFDRVQVKEIDTAVYGGVATTRELLSVRGQIAGRPVEADQRVLRVFLRRSGRWQCVNAQYTRVTAGGQ